MYKPLITDSSKKFGNNRWLAYSNKLKRQIYLFSDLEYEHWLQIETDPNIIDFCEQPLPELYEAINRNRLYRNYYEHKNLNFQNHHDFIEFIKIDLGGRLPELTENGLVVAQFIIVKELLKAMETTSNLIKNELY